MERPGQRIVILGRDGVINRRVRPGGVRYWQQFEFLPRVLEALRLLAQNGLGVVVMSREECAGNGGPSANELEKLTRRFLLEVALAGGKIEKVYNCTRGAAARCDCLAPQSGLIRKVLAEYGLRGEETYVISDSIEDVEAAGVAGCRAMLLQRDAFLTSGVPGDGVCEEIATNLYEAVERILSREKSTLEEILKKKLPKAGAGAGMPSCLWKGVVGQKGEWKEDEELQRQLERKGQWG